VIKIIIKFFFLLVFIFIICNKANAADLDKVVINELMWSGSTVSSADEWIELRNLSDQEIDISNWQIEGAAQSNGALIIPIGKKIPANGLFLISNYSKENDKTILSVDSNWQTSKISLSNSKPHIILKDSNNNVIDEVGRENTDPFAGDKNLKYSMERGIDPKDGTKSSDWHTATLSLGLKDGSIEKATPGFPNSPKPIIPVLTIDKAKERTDEISIKGLVTDLSDNLFENCIYIQDSSGGIRLKLIFGKWLDLKIGSEIIVVGKIETYYGEKQLKIADTSDIIVGEASNIVPISVKTNNIGLFEGSLIKISGTIVDKSGLVFWINDGSGRAKIYIKESTGIDKPEMRMGDSAEIIGIVNNWDGNYRVLPRTVSDISIKKKQIVQSNLNLILISEAKKQKKGSKVKISGIVSVTPGILSNNYFYIQDSSGGIQIYSSRKKFPDLKLGFLVEVIGELSESYGEKRVKINSIENIIFISAKSPPKPLIVKVKNASSSDGLLVKIKGKVIKSSGNIFYISDGTGEIKAVINKSTGIKKQRLKKGDIIEITGIIVQNRSGLKLMLRFQNDFKFIQSAPKTTKKTKAKVKSASVSVFGDSGSLNKPQLIFAVKNKKNDNFLGIIGWLMITISLVWTFSMKKLESSKKIEV